MSSALKLTSLSKNFGRTQAVSDLSLSVKKGEIYALIGPNGAGKTTTIKMITGILEPTSGDVEILGVNIKNDPVKAKTHIGYIPDEPYMYSYLTGREVLQMTGDLYGIPRSETNNKISELLKLYNLEDVIDGIFADYSRGNKQKTIILANLLHSPKVLVIDEPIVGLDVQSQQVTKKVLTDFAKKENSILVCTHTLSVAQELADRIGIIHKGELIEEGTLEDLRKKAKKEKADLEDLYLALTGQQP